MRGAFSKYSPEDSLNSSELLDLEAALRTTQAGSKSVFATVSDHARTLIRHDQAICGLEHHAYASEGEDDDEMADDVYDDNDENSDDDPDGPALDGGGATRTGDGNVPPARSDARDGPPPPTRKAGVSQRLGRR